MVPPLAADITSTDVALAEEPTWIVREVWLAAAALPPSKVVCTAPGCEPREEARASTPLTATVSPALAPIWKFRDFSEPLATLEPLNVVVSAIRLISDTS